MTRAKQHLVMQEVRLPPSGEWIPTFPGWLFIGLFQGTGYLLAPPHTREMLLGDLVLSHASARIEFRASRLDQMKLRFFYVEPEKLNCVLSLCEQDNLSGKLGQGDLALRILPAASPVAQKFSSLLVPGPDKSFSARFQMLQLFTECFEEELTAKTAEPYSSPDAKQRLELLLTEMSEASLSNLSVEDLAAKLRCSSRHAGRVFHEHFGVSFREKLTELRLARAAQLLSESDAKVINVAMESGYRSLSLFNVMFKRRFGVPPGKWRTTRVKPTPTRKGPNIFPDSPNFDSGY
ncbi:MAG: helix-turn-helix transcriptional regulator [Verrucomicrobiales bacterium]|nr:helix-turn-helix transcriptional regulator [Verrucomicrobiales bacterium]